MDIDRQLDADTMSREDMMALDLGRRLQILDALYGELKRLADLKCDAIDIRTQAKVALIKGKTTDLVANELKARADVEKIAVMISARKQQLSALQTVLRSPAA